jgi:hypothetical protein
MRPGKKKEMVLPGQHHAVRRDGVTALAGGIPRSALLKVDWPDEKVLRRKKVRIAGSVTPGSGVTVEGVAIRPDIDGHFATEVSLHEGKNVITVDAKGLEGHTVKTSPELNVDTHPPTVDTATDGMWK